MSVTLTEIFVIVVVCWTTREREIGEKCGCVRVLSATSPPGALVVLLYHQMEGLLLITCCCIVLQLYIIQSFIAKDN